MKKMLIAVGLGLLSGSLYAACFGPFCYDDTGAAVQTGLGLATANVTVSTPTYVGQIVIDSSYKLYVSTCTNAAIAGRCWVQPKNQ